MNKVFLLTGGNLGDRAANLSSALSEIGRSLGKVIEASALYETAPWGFEHEQAFLNQAVMIETSLEPLELLDSILVIEKSLGRTRGSDQWKERIIDIDILLYGSETIKEERLQVPHPYMQQRRFALVPLAEIDKDLVHPVLKKSIAQLLDECPDPLPVKPYLHEV